MPKDDDLQLDFGDDELNDPNYEQNIGAQDDASNADAGTPPDGEGQAGDAGTPPDDADNAGDAQGPDAGNGNAADDAGQQQQPRQDGNAAPTRARSDDKGNLVDKDGNIVAQAGGERRLYEQVQRQTRVISRLENELEQARQGQGDINTVARSMELSGDELRVGGQFVSVFKRDPAAAARWALQEAINKGYNLNQIVNGNGNGQPGANGNGGAITPDAIRNMVQQAVQPLLTDREQQQQSEANRQAAEREYETFMAKHEYADVHEDVLSDMLKADRSLTPEVAYWRLREYASQRGLDFSQPLRGQMQSRGQGAPASNGNATPTRTQQQQPNMAMPNGGAAMSDADTRPTVADPDDGWDQIVSESLRHAGIN